MSIKRKHLRKVIVSDIVLPSKWRGFHRSRGHLSGDESKGDSRSHTSPSSLDIFGNLGSGLTDERLSQSVEIADQKFLAAIPSVISAAWSGDFIGVCKEVSENPTAILARHEHTGWTLLHVAARRNDHELCRKLLELEPSLIGALDNSGNPALRQAVEFGDTSLVELLARASTNTLKQFDRTGRAVIVYALLAGKLENVEALLKQDASTSSNVDQAGRGLAFYCDGIDIANQYKAYRMLERYEKTGRNQWNR